MSKREELAKTIERTLALADHYAKQLDDLENLPEEPTFEEGNTCILFRKQFNAGGIYYTYCAVAVEQTGIYDTKEYVRSGYREQQKRVVWYVSGSKTHQGKAYDWESLVEWITAGEKWEIWTPGEYSLVGKSDNA